MSKVRDSVEEGMKALMFAGSQYTYMQDVKRCSFRENGRCGHASSCQLCKHYALIKHMYDEHAALPEDGYHNFYTGAGTKEDIKEYIDAFEVDIQ